MPSKVRDPNPYYCAAMVHDDFGADFHQCANKRKPNSEFCGTHSPEAEARREAKATDDYQAWKDKIEAPGRRIEQLETINHDLLAALEGYASAYHDVVCNPSKFLHECDNYRCKTGQYVIAKAKE